MQQFNKLKGCLLMYKKINNKFIKTTCFNRNKLQLNILKKCLKC